MTRESGFWEECRGENVTRENDSRTPYDRDFARIIHCPAFRRLQGKTQVLGLGDSDFYRTRLTHSMEVAQVGVAISIFLQKNYKKIESKGLLLRDLPSISLISAIGLAHDLGHPPFGHGGEIALNYCMQDYGGFEGNGQTLRILSKLEKYVPKYGLNPTRRMLLGILKYPICYSRANHNKDKNQEKTSQILPYLIKKSEYKPPKCYLDTENDVVKWIIKPFNDGDQSSLVNPPPEGGKYNLYHSLDTSIMETADDICYSVHDLEDAISLKLISKEKFLDYIFDDCNNDLLSKVDEENRQNNNGKETKTIKKTLEGLVSEDSTTRKEEIGRLVHLFVSNCKIEYNNKFENKLLAFNVKLPSPFNDLRSLLFDIVVKEVIRSPNVQHLEFKGQKIIIEIFQALATEPERFLPRDTHKKYENNKDENMKMRVICDYVSGMTDEYAAKLYERLFSPHRGSVFERI